YMFAPYEDYYTLSLNNSHLSLYNENKVLIQEDDNEMTVHLKKNDLVYLKVNVASNENILLDVTAKNHLVELPYEINSKINIEDYSIYGNDDIDPLRSFNISYNKRNDNKGLYINSNNPEKISSSELNTALTRQDVSNKDVFFTFEHNNASSYYYYGYRVTNTSDEDIYVTVKNLGYQVSGAGSWLGEDEWIKFYNTKFISDTSLYTSSQKANYDAYVGFSNSYESENRKPITYKIPSKQYMYVMGGTTSDAYNNINVFNSANKLVRGGCSNGAVLFSITGGSAEGSFLVYTDYNASTINNSEYVKGTLQNGYRVTRNDVNVGSQYIGYDNCHGVVDADFMWTINDQTSNGYLPVSYTNDYYAGSNTTGEPYSAIPLSKYVNSNVVRWNTNINPNYTSSAVGTDMTDYNTIDYESKEKICIDVKHYDGRGKVPNIGNWMVDYIETFTIINQGEKDRTFTYTLRHTGVILAFVRDEDGHIDSSFTPRYFTRIGKSDYGDGIEDTFKYTITLKAHSITRFSIDFNLLANSNGNIAHQAILQ
ncbi:MAG: hypothetical protein MR270_01875, partial [Erysipelotrichaceae bacterium]|nr:hypothetical protein [Erysipelotrichaceae bacterium]